MRKLRLLRALQLVCAAASWFTTAAGFLSLIGNTGIVALLSAGLVSFIVQAMVVVCVDEITTMKASTRVAFAAAVYLFMATISSVFSVGYYFRLFAAEDFAQEQFDRQSRQVITAADDVRASFQDLVVRLEELSDYSREMEVKEELEGRTCRNSLGAGPGPARDKRRFQKDQFTGLAGEYRRRLERIDAAVLDVRAAAESTGPGGIPSAEALFGPWGRIRSAAGGADLDGVLRPLMDYEHSGFPLGDPRYATFAGPENACQDSGTIARLQHVLDAPVPVVPQLDITQIDVTDPKAVITLIANALWDLLSGAEPLPGQVTVWDRQFRVALVFGVVVDLAILVLGLFLVAARRAFGRSGAARLVSIATQLLPTFLPLRRSLERTSGRELPEWMGDDLVDVRRVFREARDWTLVRDRHRWWFVTHKHGREADVYPADSELAQEIRELLEAARRIFAEERVIRRSPSNTPPDGMNPAALLREKLCVSTDVIKDAPLDAFEAFSVFPDLDELESQTPTSGAVADHERLLLDQAVPLRRQQGVSRFFVALCRAEPEVLARRLRNWSETRGDELVVVVGRDAGLPRALVTSFAESLDATLRRRRTGRLEAIFAGRALERLAAIAAGRADPGPERADPGPELTRCVRAVFDQDLSGWSDHPARTPWAFLADRTSILARELGRSSGAQELVTRGLCAAALAYMHAGELHNAEAQLQQLSSAQRRELSPDLRLLWETLSLGATIDHAGPWREEIAAHVEACRRLLLEVDEAAEPEIVGRAWGTLGRVLHRFQREDWGEEAFKAAIRIFEKRLPREVGRTRIYRAAALRARATSGDPQGEHLLERALNELAAAKEDLARHTGPVAAAYARETGMYLAYERARILLATGQHRKAVEAAGAALFVARGRPWPAAGLLRTQAIALKVLDEISDSRADLRELRDLGRTASGEFADLVRELERDVLNGQESTFY